MATSSLDIAIRADDQASGKLAAITRSMTSDLEAAQKTAFDLSHSAREREERDVQQHYAKLRALYQQRIQQNLKGEAHAQGRMTKALETLDLGSGDEYQRAEKELLAIRALRAKNSEVLIAIDKAEAAQRAAIQKKADNQRASDVDALNTRIFNATHSAKDREIAVVKERSRKLLDQYKHDAEMRRKITDAEEAEIGEIRKRYGNNLLGKIGRLGGRAAGPLAIIAVGTDIVLNTEDARNKRVAATTAEQGVEARIAGMELYGKTMAHIPVIGGFLQRLSDMAFGAPAMRDFLERVKETSAALSGLSKNAASAASAATASRNAALGIGGWEALSQSRGGIESAQDGAILQARETYAKARNDYEQELHNQGGLFPTGPGSAPLADFQRRRDEALQYLQMLERMTEAERKYAAAQIEDARNIERRGFWRGIQERFDLSALPTGGLEQRQALERAALSRQHGAEMDTPAFLGLDRRSEELQDRDLWIQNFKDREFIRRKKAWEDVHLSEMNEAQKKHLEGALNQEAPDAYQTEQQRVGELLQQRSAIGVAQRRQAQRQAFNQQLEREQLASDLALRSQRAKLGSSDRQADKDALELAEMDKRHADELRGKDMKVQENQDIAARQQEERQALLDRQARNVAKQRAEWRLEALQTEAATSRSYVAIRNAELKALERAQEEEERNHGKSVETTRKYAARRDAVNEAYRRARADEALGLDQAVLRAGGRGLEAEALGIRDRYKKLREEAKGDNAKLTQLDQAEKAELLGVEQQIALRNQVPNEVQAYSARFLQGGQGRNYGLDQLKESQLQTKWLQEIAKTIAATRGLTINNVSMQ